MIHSAVRPPRQRARRCGTFPHATSAGIRLVPERNVSMKRSPGSIFTVVFAIALAYGILDPTSGKAAPPGSTKLGKSALKGNTGANNTALGAQAMNPNSICTGLGTPNACCTAAGKGSCGNSGNSNTAVGSAALTSNTTGSSNTAVGGSSLLSNTTGAVNSAVGEFALASNSTGSNNAAVGYQALGSNTTANDNTAVGYASVRSNTTGAANTGLGSGAA